MTDKPENILGMEPILLILFGWLLGLLSPMIVGWYQSRQKRDTFFKAAILEMRDIQFVAAYTSLILEARHGHVTTELAELVSRILRDYQGNEPLGDVPDQLQALSGKTQEELDTITAAMAREPGAGASLKRIEPVYLNANIECLSNLPDEMQRKIYELLRTIRVVNEEIPKLDYKISMTFDSSITDENHSRLLNDIKSRYAFIAGQLRRVAEKVELVVP
jgi:hypothetical protein